MKEVDALKIVLNELIDMQRQYNEAMIYVRNPEVRNTFRILRDDEARCVERIQQKIYRMETAPWVIQKMFPFKRR